MSVALITGVTGQDGSYLAEFLLEKGYTVHGIVRRSSSFNTGRIDKIIEAAENGEVDFHFHWGDVTDANSLNRIISKVNPNEIFHLAAQSHVKVSFDVPEFTSRVDALGTLLILDIIKANFPNTKFLQASTSEMFGGINVPPNGYNEDSEFHPRSPYAAAKLFAYWQTRIYREAYQLFACNAISFNHESSRRSETFVTRKITRWFAQYLSGRHTGPLQLGNLDAVRDWGHARDYCRGFWMILQQYQPEDYVLATGSNLSVRKFVEMVFATHNFELTWNESGETEYATCGGAVVIRVNPRLYRPLETPTLLGNAFKAKRELGWEATCNIQDLVNEMVEGDIKIVGGRR